MKYVCEDNFMKICIYLINSGNNFQRRTTKINRKKVLKHLKDI